MVKQKKDKIKKGFSLASLALISISTILPGCRVNVRHSRRGVFVNVGSGIRVNVENEKNPYLMPRTHSPRHETKISGTKRDIYNYLQKTRIPFSLNPLIKIKKRRTTRYICPDFMIGNHIIELWENNELRNKAYMQNKQNFYRQYKKGKVYTLTLKNKQEIEEDIEDIIEEIYD
jgi:hypothetical protein